MFRSLIEEKIRFWHVWMDTIYPSPALTFLGSPWRCCWPSLPLRLCQKRLETADKKEPWGRAPWEQCWRAGSVCLGGTPWVWRAAVCRTELLCRGKTSKREPFPPVLWECLPPLHGRGVSPIQHGCRLVFPSKMVCLAAGRGFTGCRNNFSGSAFLRFYLFVWRMLELCKSLKKTTLDTQLLKWRKMSTKLEKWGKAPRNTLEFSGGVGSR